MSVKDGDFYHLVDIMLTNSEAKNWNRSKEKKLTTIYGIQTF